MRKSNSLFLIFSFEDLVGAVVAVFLMAVLYEGLKTLREYLVYMDWQYSRRHSRQHAGLSCVQNGRMQDNSSSDDDDDDDEGEEGKMMGGHGRRAGGQSFILTRNRKGRQPARKKG